MSVQNSSASSGAGSPPSDAAWNPLTAWIAVSRALASAGDVVWAQAGGTAGELPPQRPGHLEELLQRLLRGEPFGEGGEGRLVELDTPAVAREQVLEFLGRRETVEQRFEEVGEPEGELGDGTGDRHRGLRSSGACRAARRRTVGRSAPASA